MTDDGARYPASPAAPRRSPYGPIVAVLLFGVFPVVAVVTTPALTMRRR